MQLISALQQGMACPRARTSPRNIGPGAYPYNATFLALGLSALTMREIRLVITPLDPGHAGQALCNRICMQGQHDFE